MDHQLATLPMQGHLLAADTAHQVHRASRLLSKRQAKLVFCVLLLQLAAHFAFSAEETVCRAKTPDPLVWSMVVVMGDEVRETLTGVVQLLRIHPAPEFVLHCLPESLTLAQGLRMVAPGHHVANPLLFQELLEAVLATPREVLAALVGQDFHGLSETVDAGQERLGDEVLLLVQG
jgi:hypothetical protein